MLLRRWPGIFLVPCVAPQGKFSEVAPLLPCDGLAAGCRVAHPVIRFVEDGATHPGGFDALHGKQQLLLACYTEQHQVTGRIHRLKAGSGFQADVPHLDDLVCQGDVGSEQHVNMAVGYLPVRHGLSPRWPVGFLFRYSYRPRREKNLAQSHLDEECRH
jgi:hypothetical protein